ncbi:hypothetical protein SAV14893_051150 [Streptomyces avermitilis]|uniref:HNH nuclease domain-containing protein n=1 Tax=Streptomyces avermitilis TaxID=33903 RepID=A0A4D4LWH4_STRAX|nr:hypothetical protein SAVMC3_63460 [Streptomyces avermitilis]GDY65722.1 hypothetical protein SAV14893_051150 [Streptomyces avermitilis]GDY74060.1 hypothetical protein SAV31267_035450 [Streptomyces avermitilis]GDY83129.1 hypothetical protein SAVCW2_23280 [Streptomyces avermitilis]
MRLRVGSFCRLDYQGTEHGPGDEFVVSDESAPQWLRTGLVVPADGVWPEDATPAPKPPPKPAESHTAKPAAKPGEYVAHEPCQPPDSGRKSVCSVPRCPCQVPKGKCLECKRAHGRHRNSSAHQRAYRSKEWQRTRTAFLREHWHCECDECMLTPEILRPRAQVVDHIDGLGPLGPRAHDWTNLRAMTTAHHNRRTMRDQGNGT